MPHHESGLVALRSTDPAVIDRAAQHFLDQAPHPCVELVRAAGGKGVWLCFGSFVDTDVSAFLDQKSSARLAKALKQPIWVGHAIGGYSNEQTAMAFSAAGKRLWVSTFDFNFPAAIRREANDPFSGPERRYELIHELRAANGYGRIATEFGLDYFRVLSVDAGDALFAKEKRVLGKKGAKEHARWLTSHFVPPEGEPGDGAAPPAPADAVAFRLLGKVDTSRVAGLLAHLAAHRRSPAGSVHLRVRSAPGESVLVVEGPGVRALSTTLCSESFLRLVAALVRASALVFAWDGGESPAFGGATAQGADMFRLFRLQREPLALKGKFAPVPLAVSKPAAKEIDRLRKAMAEEVDG